jgi:lysozyme
MKVSERGINLIKKHEGCKLTSYLCPSKIPTIGFGNTYYLDGTKVELGQTITQDQADKLLLSTLSKFEKDVWSVIKQSLTQPMFDALVSFTYNVGFGNLKSSTLLKKVNKNMNDPSIRDEFLKWNKSRGRALKGLTNRRMDEWLLYSSK